MTLIVKLYITLNSKFWGNSSFYIGVIHHSLEIPTLSSSLLGDLQIATCDPINQTLDYSLLQLLGKTT